MPYVKSKEEALNLILSKIEEAKSKGLDTVSIDFDEKLSEYINDEFRDIVISERPAGHKISYFTFKVESDYIHISELKEAKHYLKLSEKKPTQNEIDFFNYVVGIIDEFSRKGDTQKRISLNKIEPNSIEFTLKNLSMKGFKHSIENNILTISWM